MPRSDDEGEDIADQKEIEEIEHVAEIGGGDDLPLVEGQPVLPLQQLMHLRSPRCIATGNRGSLVAVRGRSLRRPD